jgi:S-methylmethionine-dependent homocysteine/selenocysteine methylase
VHPAPSVFERALRSNLVLTDGGIETEIMFRTTYAMDPHLQVGAMVLDGEGSGLLRDLYEAYVVAAEPAQAPIVIGTPTFRASANFARAAGRPGDLSEINRAAVAMHRGIADGSDNEVLVAGVLGPARDAYTPEDALDVDAAQAYHGEQAALLADAGADFLFAATFPALDEAVGAGRAMVGAGLPAVVSLVLGPGGRVLDGTSLEDAVARLDQEVGPGLSYVSLSCIHTSAAAEALAVVPEPTRLRIRELKANGSPRPTAELVRLHHLESDPPPVFAERIWSLHERFGLRVIGGCCGTGPAHIAALAELASRR